MKLGFFLIMICTVNLAFTQDKIGIADTLFLLDELPSRDSALEVINAKKLANAEELRKMDSVLTRMKEYYAANKADWSSLVITTYEAQIADLQDRKTQFKTESDEDILRLNRDCDKQSQEILHQAMDKVSTELKLKAVWDKSKALSSSDEIDITDKVRGEMLKLDHP